MKQTILILLLLIASSGAHSQSKDSVNMLEAEDILHLVRKFHPVVRQSAILVNKADADVLIARSAFDPVFRYTTSDKTFNNLHYYHYASPELRIPTWYGVELFGGLEDLSGNATDPTQTLGESSYVGFSIPLAKNLVIDKRRAFLQQAKIFSTMSAIQQRQIINDLSLQAMEAYWTWVKAYQNYTMIKNNVEINRARLDLVRKSWRNGERPAIDTTEALTQLQAFQLQEQYSWLEFRNAGLELSVYLWADNNMPYTLPENVIPGSRLINETSSDSTRIDLDNLLAIAEKSHPALNLFDYKLDALQIDKNLKFQELLPAMDLSYRHLAKGYNPLETTPNSAFQNNYQYSFTLEIPLRLSQGRGEYKKAKLRLEETNLDYARKKLDIEVRIKSYYNQFLALKAQVELQSMQYKNLRKLVNAEEMKFLNGESSLFLINSRENKALEAMQKLIELKTQYFKTLYTLQWSAGLLQY